MTLLIEDYEPYYRLAGGLNTNLPAVFGGAVTFNGTATFNGAKVTPVNGSSGNTTLLASGSGQTFLFDTAAGITYTLPAPVVGATYEFVVTTSVTSSNHKVITNTGTVLLQGTIIGATTTASMWESVIGSSNISVTMNGTTTGGLVGTALSFKCLSATLWQVTGNNFGSGTAATPFATT
jgi:hypothetical protein